jgi:hypothetical protein
MLLISALFLVAAYFLQRIIGALARRMFLAKKREKHQSQDQKGTDSFWKQD